jgi:16S rRNA (guanine527-N7)-methyltransferase
LCYTTGIVDSTAIKAFFGESFQKLELFDSFLQEEGQLRGLVGPKEMDKIWERHILNSAAVAKLVDPAKSKGDVKLLDVGSGAGFPGVVVACMLPEVRVYLLDSMLRRVDWLNDVKDRLDLKNVEVVRARAEDAIQSEMLPKMDYVTARAVAPVKRLLPWCMPFLVPGGSLLALKGARVEDELEDAKYKLKKYSDSPVKVHEVAMPVGLESVKVLEVVRK